MALRSSSISCLISLSDALRCKRVGELLLRIAQLLLGIRKLAVLHAEGDLPEIVGRVLQRRVALRQLHARQRRLQQQVVGEIGDRLVGAHASALR